MHGWQDNAGTFDRLIPLLPSHVAYLAIDFPGHGLSSWLPNGCAYHAIDLLYVLDAIRKEYNWEKLSILGHSLGSLTGFMYASVFPDRVDYLIGLDALKPHVRETEIIPHLFEYQVGNFMTSNLRNLDKSEPPSYTYEDLVEKICAASDDSLNKEVCPYLLGRAIKKSEKYPDRYYFARDGRLKQFLPILLTQPAALTMAERIQIPYLFIKAKQASYYEKQRYFHETIDVLKKNKLFELEYVDSTHHFHLTDPTIASGIISDFINRQKGTISKL